MTTGDLSRDKDKTLSGMRTHNALQLMLKQTRHIETPLSPSTAREPREAKEARQRARARAKASLAKEREGIRQYKPTGHQHNLKSRLDSVTTAASTSTYARTASNRTDAKLLEQPLAVWRRPQARQAVPEVCRLHFPHRPREG